MTSRDDLASFLSDAQLELDLREARERRTQRLDEIRAAFSRADAEFFSAQHPVFEEWRRQCHHAETRYFRRKLSDASISRFPGLADLLSGVVARRS